ncbi:MAG: DUF4956 domain-containing protein [Anaerolineae bacterium]|nr:DUF4956 domain-containing protein [Anaerolineae bacterium]
MNDLVALEELSLEALGFNLVLGIALSALVAWYYARYGEALSNRNKFARLLPVLCLVTILVISVVKASLALSLGLVGALSIVRFRTAIKDPEELIYLFFAIAIGLGLGADQRLPTVVAVGVIMALLIGTRLLSRRSRKRNMYLNIQVPEGDGEASFEAVNEILVAHAAMVDMRRLDRLDHRLQIAYLLECDDQVTVSRLMDALKARIPGCTFSFVDHKSLPDR